MINAAAGGRREIGQIVGQSPLRAVDARIKLAIVLIMTAASMLPLQRLAVLIVALVGFIAYARLLSRSAKQVWRIRWLLVALFALDSAFIGLEFAVLITVRFVVIVSVSTLLVATTTPEEFRQALIGLAVPYHLAFALGLAFQSVPLMGDEWRHIHEAQRARGVLRVADNWRDQLRQLTDLVALAVPAIVLTTQRAWALTESVHARGFGSPKHRRSEVSRPAARDWLLAGGTLACVVLLALLH